MFATLDSRVMMSAPGDEYDLQAAHRRFAADCYNRAWDYIVKDQRTPAECEEMVQLAIVSLWHWTQRADCTRQNLSIGHWQTSRVYALVGDAKRARRHGQRSLEYANDSPPFYKGYAHEALARAAIVAADMTAASEHLFAARSALDQVADVEERHMLESDLADLTAAIA